MNELKEKQEQAGLRVAMVGAVVMCVLGIGFALLSGSDAIMLDGVFSGLGFFMALATLWVSRLVRRPDDEHFQFGYAHFAPLLNVLKSGLVVILCGFALLSSIRALIGGGRELVIGSAVIYGLLASFAGVLLALYLKRAARQSGSVLVALDAKGAIIDAMMSFAVLASFALGYWLQDRVAPEHLNYLDPSVVAFLCLCALPMPLKILWNNAREVLLIAPDPSLQADILRRIEGAIGELPLSGHRVRMLKMGNTMNVLLHLVPGQGAAINSIELMDGLRNDIADALAGMEQQVAVDVVFLGDIDLAH